MKKLRLLMQAAVFGVSVNVTLAQTSPSTQTMAQAQEISYGSQLMTVQERIKRLGATMNLKTAPGQGTVLQVAAPLVRSSPGDPT
jgi:signal transduction histidine kinase